MTDWAKFQTYHSRFNLLLLGSTKFLIGVSSLYSAFFLPSVQKEYKASNNEIQSLPDTISLFWRTHLQEVDFSENSLKELPSYIFELEVSAMKLDQMSGGKKLNICKSIQTNI